MVVALILLVSQIAPPESAPDHITLDTRSVQGEYYAPASTGKRLPSVLILHGSEGSTQYTSAAAAGLAKAGFAALAVRYFGGRDQPRNLVNVPMETFARGLEWLRSRPEVDRRKVFVLGYSRGAEAALDFATIEKRIAGVVAVSGACMRFQGFISMTVPCPDAAFTLQGQPRPFTKLTFFGRSIADLYSSAVKDPANERNWIPVERIRGPIMLISGQSDPVWASSMMAGQIVRRLKTKGFRHELRWHDYPNAGHVLLTPSFSGLSGPTQFGGTAEGVATAMHDAWPSMIEFLRRSAGIR